MKTLVFSDLSVLSESIGKTVSISAVFVISSRSAYLVSSSEDPESNVRVEIVVPGLEKKLDSIVGGWMGGRYTYLDPVTVEGKLCESVTKNGLPVLLNVSLLVLNRDGEQFTIAFDK